MSTIRRDGNRIELEISTLNIGGRPWRIPFRYECASEWEACLAVEVLAPMLHKRMQQIRLDSYQEALRDQKAHWQDKTHKILTELEEFSSDF